MYQVDINFFQIFPYKFPLIPLKKFVLFQSINQDQYFIHHPHSFIKQEASKESSFICPLAFLPSPIYQQWLKHLYDRFLHHSIL